MPKTLSYIYTWDHSESAAGYFFCAPSEKAEFRELLEIYGERPLDSFLRDWLLREAPRDSVGRILCPGAEELSTAAQRGLIALQKAVDFLRKQNLQTGASYPGRVGSQRSDEKYDATSPGNNSSPEKTLAGIAARKTRFASSPVDPRSTAAKALEVLTRAGILVGGEMRHEASLSPIALLRKWRIDCRADTGRNSHTLAGEAIAYGRGLSLAAARTACLMETVERVCSYPSIETTAAGAIVRNRKNNGVLTRAAPAELRAAGRAYWHPPTGCDIDLYPFYWLPGETPAGDQIMIPAQAVFLFCNLDEETIFDGAGSTGLATGATLADARLAALTEVLERESDALAPASRAREFILESRDLRIRELLSDYRFRGINILMRDIGEADGLPIYRCETRGRNGKCASASAANLNGASAALAALTETPWPYSWSNPQTRSEPTIPPRPGTPVRYLEDLPNYDLGSAEANLVMLEEWLAINGRRPVYVDISREDLDFPVVRAFVTAADNEDG